MNYFLDTEFINEPARLELVSLALVADDGRELYAVNTSVDTTHVPAFVRAHVLPVLHKTHQASVVISGSPCRIAAALHRFVNPDVRNEIWGYFSDYDWVLTTRLFGDFDRHPKGWPMYCRDLKQWADQLGVNKFPPQSTQAHHALIDARWNKDTHAFLRGKAEETP